MTVETVKEFFGISSEVYAYVNELEKEVENTFGKKQREVMEYNQGKVLKAMQEEKLASTDFHWTTGYGYGDYGREKVEKIYSRIFHTDKALVRPNIVSGTHAIFLTIRALLKRGEELLSLCGPLYDTMQKAIGITGDAPGSLLERGVHYKEVPLLNGKMQVGLFHEYINERTKVVMIQRSTGYSERSAFTTSQMKEAIEKVREISKDVIIFVDNCYGEFTDILEPTDYGADIVAGSLIKNPGGGLALSGGYVAGRGPFIDRIVNDLTAPGIGGDCGLTFGMTRQVLQGLFLAPQVVTHAMKGAKIFALAFENFGYSCIPDGREERSDIIQAVTFHDPEKLKLFCQSIQGISPVDAHFTPEYWDMPGYTDPVIMAAGGFVEGSSIELSADGPKRPPYTAFFQGGLTFTHCKLALCSVLENFKKAGYLSF